MARVPRSLAATLDALGDDGIRWTLLRPRATLAATEGDVDVLVEPGDMAKVRRVVTGRGFVEMPVGSADFHAAHHDRDAGRFVWLHVQDHLHVAGASVPASEVLAAATGGDIPEPGADWLLWILLLRALVDKGVLADRHRPHVQALAADWRGGPERLLVLARERGLDPQAVVATAARGDWDGLLAAAAPMPQPQPSRARRAARIPARLARVPALVRALRERHGISIAVIGPDGAGKTTLIEGLARTLPMPTVIQYMGLTGGRLPRADALRVPGLVFAARLLVLWLRYARSVAHRARGRTVLFDRYTLDGAVPSGMRLSAPARLSRRMQRRACPLPDVVFLLDASGTTMYARKGEYDSAVLEGWRAAYRRLESRVPALAVLDAEQDAETVLRRAEAIVWERYLALRSTGRRLR